MKLIRVDMCVTLHVPNTTVIDEDGSIILPDGLELQLDSCMRWARHTYYTTPVEVSEIYEGNDH